jgi:uncharacterized protein (DUF983 family)
MADEKEQDVCWCYECEASNMTVSTCWGVGNDTCAILLKCPECGRGALLFVQTGEQCANCGICKERTE